MFSLVLFSGFAVGLDLACDEALCPLSWVGATQRGDGWCDPPCNSVVCGFDSPPEHLDLDSSDCAVSCLSSIGCLFPESLRSYCWQFYSEFSPCTTEDTCGWTRGKCGYCSFGCKDSSGFQSDLADGVCKKECATSECAFDGGDCVRLTQGFCASGCFESMLGDGICQNECLTEHCENDRGDCDFSLCNRGCFPYMVDDGNCQNECHVEECQWDGRDCDCSPGCTEHLLTNDLCDSLCNSKDCEFDGGRCATQCSPGCEASMLGDGVCDAECFNLCCEGDSADCECAPGCAYSDIGHCKPECQVPECSYDMPDSATMFCTSTDPAAFACSSATCVDDVGEEVHNCDYTCQHCGGTIHYKLSCCPDCCSEGYFPHPLYPDVCVRSPDHTSKLHPRIIHVAAESGSETPDGSESYPSLSAAFASMYEKYVEIRLLPGVHSLTPSKYFTNQPAFIWMFDEQIAQAEGLRSLKITSLSCVDSPNSCDRASILVSYDLFLRFAGAFSLEIISVDFTSHLELNLCENVMDFTCVASKSVLELNNGLTARLTNVTFIGLKHAFSSVISVHHSTLLLEHTCFIDIVVKYQNNFEGLIKATEAEVVYTGGVVSRINNRWDYHTVNAIPGFLAAMNSSVTITRVNFTHNFASVRQEDNTSLHGSLLLFQDCWQVTITRCEFAFNVGYKGAVISFYTFLWNLTSGEYQTAKRILESGIDISSCLFRNNTGRVGSSIYVHYLGAQQNFAITNCTFLNELAEVGGVIIAESQARSSTGHSKHIPALTVNRRVRIVEYPAPTFSLANVSFVNCSGGRSGLLVLDKMWVASAQGVTIVSGNLPASDVVANSLQALSALSDAHTPLFVPFYPPQPCQCFFSITSVTYLSVESLRLYQTICNAGISVSGTNITISNSYFGYNSGSSGSVLHIKAVNLFVHSLLFEYNRNEDLVGRGSAFIEATNVSIANCAFRNNSASMGGAVYVNSTSVLEISACEFDGNSAAGGGALAVEGVGSAALRLFSTRFTGNYAEDYAGAVCLFTRSESFHVKAEFTDTVLTGSTAAKGSALFVSEGVVFLPGTVFQSCQVTDNVARQYGILLFELIRGEMRFERTHFQRNSGTEASVLHITYSLAPTPGNRVQLFNSVFEDNSIGVAINVPNFSAHFELLCAALICRRNSGSCLYLEHSVFTCTQCVFAKNLAQSGAGIYARYSQALCEDSVFDTNVAEFAGGAVLAKSESEFVCRRCEFLNNFSQWQGGALFFEENSTLILDASTFANNTALSGGFAVFLFKCDLPSEIRDSLFIGNTGNNFGSINAASSHLKLTGCNITENHSSNLMGGVMLSQSIARVESCRFFRQNGLSGTLLYAFGSNVTIANSAFRDSVASNTGAGMTLISSSVTIVNSSLHSLVSGLGGAISAQSGSALLIDGCSFANITSSAINNGVVVASESLLTVVRSEFAGYTEGGVTGNSASLRVASSYFHSGSGTFGGGIFCSDCEAVEISWSRFDSLRAERGAAVYFEKGWQKGRWTITACTFADNRGTSSGAVHLGEWSGQLANSSFLSNQATAGSGGAVHISAGNTTIASNLFHSNSAKDQGGAITWSGSQPSMSSNTFTNNSALYGPDFASYGVRLALLGPISDYANLTSGEVSEKPIVLMILDANGQVVVNDNKSFAKVEATDNKTVFSGVSRVQAQGGVFNFSELRVIGQPGTNASLTISSPGVNFIEMTVLLRVCRAGEALVSSQCTACAPGTYSLKAGGDCQDCPSGGICLGSNALTPRSGYWRSGPDLFQQCLNAEACAGSECAPGYQGAMCQACAPGFYQWGKIYCAKCSDSTTSIAMEVVVSVLIISSSAVFIVVVLRSQRRSYYMCAVYIKIFVDYVQTVMLFRSFDLSWPQEILQLFSAYEAFGAFPEYLVSANCLVPTDRHKVLILALIQPGLVLLALAVWSLISFTRKSTQYVKSHFICSAIMLFLLAYPSVMRGMLGVFECVQVGAGEFWLLQYNQQCWTTKYKRDMLAVAIPGAICWGVAVPGLLLLALRRHNSDRFRLTYLTLGYAEKHSYWEYVIIYRKVLLIACFVFVTHISATSPAITALGILLISFTVHWSQPPYAYSEHSSMERRSLCVCAGTLYCGLVANTRELEQNYALLTAILLLNAYFVGLFAWKMCRTWHGAARMH